MIMLNIKPFVREKNKKVEVRKKAGKKYVKRRKNIFIDRH